MMARLVRTIALIGLVALAMVAPALTAGTPKFQVDPSWPKTTLPNNWIFSQIGVFVDAQDHVWVDQRPGTLDARRSAPPPRRTSRCCFAAPPIIEFDQAGNVVHAWGGPGQGL